MHVRRLENTGQWKEKRQQHLCFQRLLEENSSPLHVKLFYGSGTTGLCRVASDSCVAPIRTEPGGPALREMCSSGEARAAVMPSGEVSLTIESAFRLFSRPHATTA